MENIIGWVTTGSFLLQPIIEEKGKVSRAFFQSLMGYFNRGNHSSDP
jgi:hypothetical protein